ncbi:MAG: hypothetical protein ACR2IE_02225 [Candidatus Sumerlaeaceae bacterium]
MEPQRFETLENVIAYAQSIPDFPNKPLILEQLETRNVNRFQQAMAKLNEVLVQNPDPEPSSSGGGASREQLQELVNRITQLDASDPVGG